MVLTDDTQLAFVVLVIAAIGLVGVWLWTLRKPR